jgi:hypothetical protein
MPTRSLSLTTFTLSALPPCGAWSFAASCRPPMRRRRLIRCLPSGSAASTRHRCFARRGACDTTSRWPTRCTSSSLGALTSHSSRATSGWLNSRARRGRAHLFIVTAWVADRLLTTSPSPATTRPSLARRCAPSRRISWQRWSRPMTSAASRPWSTWAAASESCSRQVLRANPDARGVLFDVPDVLAGARPVLDQVAVTDRCQTVAEDSSTPSPTAATCTYSATSSRSGRRGRRPDPAHAPASDGWRRETARRRTGAALRDRTVDGQAARPGDACAQAWDHLRDRPGPGPAERSSQERRAHNKAPALLVIGPRLVRRSRDPHGWEATMAHPNEELIRAGYDAVWPPRIP